MVADLSEPNPTETASISAEAAALMATRPYYRAGLRQLGALLPDDDADLHQWFEGAAAAHDEDSFIQLFAAACITGRKLQASLICPAVMLRVPEWHIAWAAWRMEGEVTDEILDALGAVPMKVERRALLLLVAAAWWKEHHPGEEQLKQVMHLAVALSKEGKPNPMTMVYMVDLGILLGGEAPLAQLGASVRKPMTPKLQQAQMEKMYGQWNGSFDRFIYEHESHDYISTRPMRRAVKKIGGNEICPCGSGKKYKRCCQQKDELRRRDSSSVAGVTKGELHQLENAELTKERLESLGPAQLAKLDPTQVPQNWQEVLPLVLARMNYHDEAIAVFRKLAVCEEGGISLPKHLHQAWSLMFDEAAQSWRPEVARQLMEVFPDAREKLGVKKIIPAIVLLLVGDDAVKFLQTLEEQLRLVLASGTSEELQQLAWTVIESPYRALGIMLARSLLPIVEEKYVPGLFEGILAARAKLNLSPDDEFSDFMDEHALRSAGGNESKAGQEAQDKLAANGAELRRTKEELAQANRELEIKKRQERRSEVKAAPQPDSEAERKIRELKEKVASLNAIVSEGIKERVVLRRDAQEKARENEALKAATNHHGADEAESEDELLEVTGTQPVRLIDFPKGFAETLASYPAHVGRAAMNRLGRIASGEPGAFQGVWRLEAYPNVLRGRVSDKYRLLFSLTPDRVRVVDLIRRADLERRIERLQASGIPSVA